ncbi:hypothetical protein X975_01122, partial [Stegodyphus mimosarum]
MLNHSHWYVKSFTFPQTLTPSKSNNQYSHKNCLEQFFQIYISK